MKFYLKIHILYRLLIFTVNALILLLPKNNFDVMHVISVFMQGVCHVTIVISKDKSIKLIWESVF